MPKVLKAITGTAMAAAALILALTVPPNGATAQSRDKSRGMAACRADAAAFCKGIEPGRGARTTCLAAVKEKLAPDCAAALEARLANRDNRVGAAEAPTPPPTAADATQARQPEPQQPDTAQAKPLPGPGQRSALGARPARGPQGRPMAACRADMQTLCAEVPQGGGARMRCLAENQGKLSPACADALTARGDAGKSQRADMRGACRADAQSLCRDAKGPERRQCLTANVDKLTADCAAALNGPRG